jgi:hypothetical protein
MLRVTAPRQYQYKPTILVRKSNQKRILKLRSENVVKMAHREIEPVGRKLVELGWVAVHWHEPG